MTATKSQNLVRLEDSISETNLVAIVRLEPDDITEANKLEFCQSFDDLDYLVFATLSLPSGDRIGLIRHQNSPSPGTEICVRYNQTNIATVLQEALTKMNLTLNDLTWIHPEYKQHMKTNLKINDNVKKAAQELKKYCLNIFDTQKELAASSDISKSYLARLCQGQIKTPGENKTIDLLKALSEKSGKEIDKVWDDVLKIYKTGFKINSKYIQNIEIKIKPESRNNKSERNLFKQDVKQNLPARPENIFGREKELDKLLNHYLIRPGQIVFSGTGGIGKTTLALEAAYRCLESSQEDSRRKFGAIIFTSAKKNSLHNSTKILPINFQDNNLNKILNKISSVLRVEKIKRETDLEKQCELAYEELAKIRTLLIVDNLETMEGQEDLLAFLNPMRLPSTVTVIITTRNLTGLGNFPIGKLEAKYSLQIIQRQIDLIKYTRPEFDLSEKEKEKLQIAADGIPIVIGYSILLIAQGYIFEEVIRKIENPQGNLARFLFEEAVNQLKESIDYRLLMAMGILNKPMRRDAIIAIAGLSQDRLSQDLSISEDDVGDALVRLTNLSLIEYQRNEEIYSIPSLTHRYAHAHLKRNKEFESEVIARWIEYYLEFARTNGRRDILDWETGNWFERFDEIDKQWENFEAVSEFCIRTNRYHKFKSIWISLSNYTEVYGRWSDHYRWLENLKQKAKNIGDDQTTIFAMSAIARVYIREGSEEKLKNAEVLLEEARNFESCADLPVRVELFENHIMLHIARKEYDLASNELQKLEEFVKNEQLLEKFVRDKKLSYEEKIRYKIRYKLPFKYRKAQVLSDTGNRESAIKMFREVIDDTKQIDWVLARIGPQNRLGDLLIEDKDTLEKAEEVLKSTLSIAKANKYHRRTAYCYFSLGRLFYKRNNYSRAIENMKMAQEKFELLGMETQQQDVENFLRDLKT